MITRCLALLSLVLAASATSAAQVQDAPPYDLLIRNARVLDGTGNPWFRADVALASDRIAAIGDLADAEAGRIIEAEGLYLAPGFIDTHSHAGGGLAAEPLSHARPLLAQGIVTVFVNPDGGGPADLVQQREALLEHGLGVNVAQFVPHGAVRRAAMENTSREATADEIAEMRRLVRREMEAGAFGLSTGLFYAPGSFAATEEVIELAEEVARFGGVHQSHIRDEADYTIGVVASVDEIIRISAEAGLPGIVTHIKCLGPNVWGASADIIQRIERAREAGVEVWADQYPYEASSTSLSAALLPRIAADDSQAESQSDEDPAAVPQRRRRIIAENLARRGGPGRIQFARFRQDASIEGRTLEQIAAERNLDPIDLAIELLDAGNPSIVSFNMHADDIAAFMRRPWMMTASDGGLGRMGQGMPHPRSYGAFPRKIRKYVIEEDVIDLAAAIRSMTHLPATVYRLQDRGQIRPGAIADLVIFDLQRINDPADFADPHHLAEGMVHVLVNGQLAIEDGAFTSRLAGQVLSRRPD